MIATIGRITTVISATFLRHIAKAKYERKNQSCGARIANTTTMIIWANGVADIKHQYGLRKMTFVLGAK
jgi:hypothetical protein